MTLIFRCKYNLHYNLELPRCDMYHSRKVQAVLIRSLGSVDETMLGTPSILYSFHSPYTPSTCVRFQTMVPRLPSREGQLLGLRPWRCLPTCVVGP